MTGLRMAGLIAAGLALAAGYALLQPPEETAAAAASDIQVMEGLQVTYLATPALLDELGLHPRREFGVADNGNVVLNTEEGVFELAVHDGALESSTLYGEPLDAMALDSGAVTLGIRGRFFGQLGPEGFDKALPLPEGELYLAASSRPGWVYLVRNEPGGGRLYGIWDNGTLSTLAELPSRIQAVTDDERRTYVAGDDGLLAIDEETVQVISKATADFPPADALAARGGKLFATVNDRVYVVADGVMLAIARGIAPQLALHGDRLYCWDPERRLLLHIDIAPLYAD